MRLITFIKNMLFHKDIFIQEVRPDITQCRIIKIDRKLKNR